MKYLLSLLLIISLLCTYVDNNAQSSSSADLVATLLADTPIEEDLQELCDHFGGRVTGTANNLASVEWGLQKFLSAGVKAQKESFDIPSLWVENGIVAKVTGAAQFNPKVVAKYYSQPTPAGGVQAEIIDVGSVSYTHLTLPTICSV